MKNNKKPIIISKKSLLFVFLLFLYFSLFSMSILSIMPSNPIKDTTQIMNSKVHQILPQGWAFYSRNPRDITYNVLKTETGEKAVQFPNASISNLFGLSRYGRSQGVEIGRLISRIPQNKWTIIYSSPLEYGKSMKKIPIKNDQIKPKVKGDILIYYSEPIPWNWAKTFSSKNNMTTKIIRLEVY